MSGIADRIPADRRFWGKVVKTDGCWLWTGSTSRGYGKLFLPGPRTISAHRFSYLLHFGPFDKRLVVCHSCDTRACVRPDHLFLGTQEDNVTDMVDKGRHWKQRNTHCPQGHLFDAANTYVGPRTSKRECRTCRAQRAAQRSAA